MKERLHEALTVGTNVAGTVMPRNAVVDALAQATEGLSLALCLHRVGKARRSGELEPAMFIPEGELSSLLTLLEEAGVGAAAGTQLTLSFDDGYPDAFDFVRRYAPHYPDVEWLAFICPEKIDARTGFRWDVEELARYQGRGYVDDGGQFLYGSLDIEAENRRDDLREVQADQRYRLVDWDAVRELEAMPNVTVGNHTNCHFVPARLGPDVFAEEMRRSEGRLVEVLGPRPHFAFPYGTPDYEVTDAELEVARSVAGGVLWSTEPRPYHPDERGPGALLPRFPVDGTRGATALALWMAERSLRHRLRQ